MIIESRAVEIKFPADNKFIVVDLPLTHPSGRSGLFKILVYKGDRVIIFHHI